MDGLVISEVSGDIEARDAKTMKLRWNFKYHPGPNRHAGTTGSSKVMDLDGVRVLVMSSVWVVRVSDGKVLLVNFAAPAEERARQRLAMMGASTKPDEWADEGCWTFSWFCPFTFSGSRVNIRSLDELICVGGK